MDSLKISSTALGAVGGALAQVSGFLGDAKQLRTGDAGHRRLTAKGEEVAAAWLASMGPLTEAVATDGKQCIAAGQEFARIDNALAAVLTVRTP
jgi:hypothetical protein